MHAGISTLLAQGSEHPETRKDSPKRSLQWHNDKTKYIEDIIHRDITYARVNTMASIKRQRIFYDLSHLRRKEPGQQVACANALQFDTEWERQLIDDFIKDEEDARERERELIGDYIRDEEDARERDRELTDERKEMLLDDNWVAHEPHLPIDDGGRAVNEDDEGGGVEEGDGGGREEEGDGGGDGDGVGGEGAGEDEHKTGK